MLADTLKSDQCSGPCAVSLEEKIKGEIRSGFYRRKCHRGVETEDFILTVIKQPVPVEEVTINIVNSARTWFSKHGYPYTIRLDKKQWVLGIRKERNG